MPSTLIKHGNLDNVATYEYVADTVADMNNINKKEINLGSTCMVLKGASGKVEIYVADSTKEWILLSIVYGSASSNNG